MHPTNYAHVAETGRNNSSNKELPLVKSDDMQ